MRPSPATGKVYPVDLDYVTNVPPLGEPLPPEDEKDDERVEECGGQQIQSSMGEGHQRQVMPLHAEARPSVVTSTTSTDGGVVAAGRPASSPLRRVRHPPEPTKSSREEDGEDEDDEGGRVLEEVRRLVAAERDEGLLLQLCAHHLPGMGIGASIREALVRAAAAADLPRRQSLLAALQVSMHFW